VRSGHAAPFFFVAQWFPKLAVLGADGRWQAHQYHAASEFFADFASYDVRLTVPADVVVGATGVVTAAHDNGDGTRTLDVRAEAVHDFAWAADRASRSSRSASPTCRCGCSCNRTTAPRRRATSTACARR